MKRLSLYLFLILFSLQTPSWADDIREFQIEGMSIGDSLLDYFSESEINKQKKNFYPKSKKYYYIEYGQGLEIYDVVSFHIKKNDKKYIIAAIKGGLDFPEKMKECKKKKKELEKEVSLFLQKPEEESYDFNYPEDKGKSSITDFKTSGGKIRIWCTDWKKSSGYIDHLGLSISPTEYLKWLYNEAR